MAAKGVNTPFGLPAKSVAEAVAAAEQIGDDEVVIKSQILAGGRGLGTFTNGFQGGVHVIKSSEVSTYADKMLGQTLVTKQSGPAGKPVDTLLIAKKMNLVREMYLAIMLDRSTMGAREPPPSSPPPGVAPTALLARFSLAPPSAPPPCAPPLCTQRSTPSALSEPRKEKREDARSDCARARTPVPIASLSRALSPSHSLSLSAAHHPLR